MISGKGEKQIIRYVDEFASKLELEDKELKDFEEEMIENLKSSVDELMKQGYGEKEAISKAIDQFGDDSIIEEMKQEYTNKERDPVVIYNLLIGGLIAIAAIFFFVPYLPVKVIAILGVIAGIGSSIMNQLYNKE